jgi:hypothetical protein
MLSHDRIGGREPAAEVDLRHFKCLNDRLRAGRQAATSAFRLRTRAIDCSMAEPANV